MIHWERQDYVKVHVGDCREVLGSLPSQHYDTCITSPPYFQQRDYGIAGQIGLEVSLTEYIHDLVAVFDGVRERLRDDGTLWLNLGDGYANEACPSLSIKPRDMFGLPWRVAFALQESGWYLRQDIVWEKPDTMPEPAKSRCVKSHEYVFLLSKTPHYYFDWEAIREVGNSGRKGVNPQKNSKLTHGAQSGGNTGINAAKVKMLEEYETHGYVMRNKRSVWHVSAQQGSSDVRNEHYATYPPDLIRPMIQAGSRYDGYVLDPFGGTGTTGLVARELGRHCDLIEINPTYAAIAERRACWT